MTPFLRSQLRITSRAFVRGFNEGFGWGLGIMTAIVLWTHFVGKRLANWVIRRSPHLSRRRSLPRFADPTETLILRSADPTVLCDHAEVRRPRLTGDPWPVMFAGMKLSGR